MTASPVDPGTVLAAASQQDLVQRKQSIDALRKRLGDNKTEEQALRESCEGFESIFLQKMWEQMRKNVPKEGYLHSKDEEMYQSLFDVELCKKMTTAGGIGLADMLYEQLSQQLTNTGRTTSPSAYRPPVIPPAVADAAADSLEAQPALSGSEARAVLSVENLYSPLKEGRQEEGAPEAQTAEEQPEKDAIGLALAEFAEKEAQRREESNIDARYTALADTPHAAADEKRKNKAPLSGDAIQAASWHSGGRVSATPRPISTFTRKIPDSEPVSIQPAATAVPFPGQNLAAGGISAPQAFEGNPTLPDRAHWPVEGRVLSPFGWDEANGHERSWSPGIFIDAPAGARVAACMQGTIVYNDKAEGFDNLVVIDHGENFRSFYGNVDTRGLKTGDSVSGGMLFASVKIADQKDDGAAKNSSFYFGLKHGDVALNPEVAIPRFLTAQR